MFAIDLLDVAVKIAIIVLFVMSIKRYFDNVKYSYYQGELVDSMALRHFYLCKDIVFLCDRYSKCQSKELEYSILSKFHQMIVIDRDEYVPVRNSIYFDMDMYCKAVNHMNRVGLLTLYEEVYHERG